MKIHGPLLSSFAHGTLAKLLIFRPAGRAHTVYRHFKPKQPGTTAQKNHHVLFGLLANRCNTLTRSERDYWSTPYHEKICTPYNAYLCHNLRRLNPAVPAGLIAWWTNIVPTGAIFHDLSRSHFDGHFIDLSPKTAWVYDNVRRGHVLELDGTGYVNVPSPPSVTDPFTIAAWFKQKTSNSYDPIITTGHPDQYLFGYLTPDYLWFFVRTWSVRTTTKWATVLDWHHVASLWDGTHIRLYVDGSHIQSKPLTDPPEPQVTMYFGRRLLPLWQPYLKARLDDIRIYNRALQPSEVLELASR